MSWIAAAIGGSALLGAGASYFGGQAQGNAAETASAQQYQAYLNAMQMQAPWLNIGGQAQNELGYLMGLSPATSYTYGTQGSLGSYPAFNFNLGTAMNADNTGGQVTQEALSEIGAQRSATGGFGSGNQATDISNYIAGTYEPSLYNQSLQSYNTNYQTQAQQPFNMLSSLSGMGAQAAGIAGQDEIGAGNALASGTMGQANAFANSLQGIGNQINSGAGLYLNYLNSNQLMNMYGANNAGMGGGGYMYNPANNPYDQSANPYYGSGYNMGSDMGMWG